MRGRSADAITTLEDAALSELFAGSGSRFVVELRKAGAPEALHPTLRNVGDVPPRLPQACLAIQFWDWVKLSRVLSS